ncbi:DinB family protein [Thalassobacillus sp. CUG 92003]|uniref:DinB family protein n=1 Tax=Thalassobacillus sp. CUG 92003 TaxID=2736641 RepID=UPI0015E6FF6E|nr:DinB family protein [Thalassobacillus sp. CUG 92003]
MNSQTLINGLRGDSAHVNPSNVFEELDWETAGETIERSPYTVWELIWHMNYWQRFLLELIQGKEPVYPEHSDESWPRNKMPQSKAEWDEEVSRFTNDVKIAEEECEKDLNEMCSTDNTTRQSLLMDLVIHNSYHGGQVVLLRRQLGSWPPPSGGDTW